MADPTEPGYKSNMSPEGAENLASIKSLEKIVLEKFEAIKEINEKVEGQLKETGSIAVETKAELQKTADQYNELYERVKDLEQKGVGIHEKDAVETIGEQYIKSDQFKALQAKQTRTATFETKTAIINATGQNQPLVPADRVQGIYTTENRQLMVRDIITSIPTSSNLVEFVRENVFTNNAGPQIGGSPQAFENVTKPESGITFTLANEAVQTLAHFIPASKQVIGDSPQLQAFINGRLMYGLKLYEENQILNGTGANGQLNGIVTQATAYTVQSPNLTNELDIIREMIKQAQVANYTPDYILLNPQDWYDIDVRKVGASDDRYVVGNPRAFSVPRLWGIPVVITNAMTAGTALVGAFGMGCALFDREEMSVSVSLENQDNFEKNMITILAEERVALVVYRTESFITGAV